MGGRGRATFGKEGGRLSHSICAASGTPPWRGRWSHPSAGPAANPCGVPLNGKSGFRGSLRHTLSPEEGLSSALSPGGVQKAVVLSSQPCCSRCNGGHGVGSTGITWELVRHADSQAPSLRSSAKCHMAMETISTRPEAGSWTNTKTQGAIAAQPSPYADCPVLRRNTPPSISLPPPILHTRPGLVHLAVKKNLGRCKAELFNRSANICTHAERMRGGIQLEFALCRLQINF